MHLAASIARSTWLPYGLTLSAIGFWRSGTAFNPRGLIDSDGDGLVDQRDLSQPRNAFRIEAYGDIDLRIEKRIPFGSQAISVLVEAFNLFNRFNWGNPTTSFASGNFGRIQSAAGDPRILQFGIKYGF